MTSRHVLSNLVASCQSFQHRVTSCHILSHLVESCLCMSEHVSADCLYRTPCCCIRLVQVGSLSRAASMDSLTLEVGHVLCCCASPRMRCSVRTFALHDETRILYRILNALVGPSPMNQEYQIASIRNTFNSLEVNSFDAHQPAKQVALKPALAQVCNAHCLTLNR